MTYMDFYQSIAHYFSDKWNERITINLNGEKYAIELEEVEGRAWNRRFDLKLVKLEN